MTGCVKNIVVGLLVYTIILIENSAVHTKIKTNNQSVTGCDTNNFIKSNIVYNIDAVKGKLAGLISRAQLLMLPTQGTKTNINAKRKRHKWLSRDFPNVFKFVIHRKIDNSNSSTCQYLTTPKTLISLT